MKPKPFVFVLMPFADEFNDIYQLGIKQTCEEVGAYCERVDEQVYTERILDRIYNQIVKADIIIADMTGKNPNVFYEVGYAHGLGKEVLLLTQKKEDIPFDFLHFPHIIYENKITLLKQELRRKVEWLIANPTASAQAFSLPLEILIMDNKIGGSSKSICLDNDGRFLETEVKFYNNAETTIRSIIFRFGLIAGTNVRDVEVRNTPCTKVGIQPEQILFMASDELSLLPGTLASRQLTTWSVNGRDLQGRYAIRVFTDSGYFDYPFEMVAR